MQENLSLNEEMFLYRSPIEYTLLRKHNRDPTSVIAHLNISAGHIISLFDRGKKIGEVLDEISNSFENINKEEFYIFIENMLKKGILKYGNRDLPASTGSPEMFLPVTLQIEVTRRCVLNCRHCYISEREFEEKINPNSLTYILDLLEPYNLPLNVQITGGEPLLRDDIFEILDILEERKKRFSFYTTGLLVDDQISRKLSEYSNLYSIHISLDGNEKEHEYLRGKGTYQKTLEGINILNKYNKYVEVGTVLRKSSLQCITHVNEALEKMKNVEIGIGYFIPVGNGKNLSNEVPTMKDFVDGIKLSEELGITKSDLFKWKEDVEYLEKLYMSEDGFASMVHSLGIGGGNCGAGYVSVSLAPNGDVYPCVIVGSYPEFMMGNIFKDSLEKIFGVEAKRWAYRKTPSSATCAGCPYISYCNKCFGYVAAFCNDPTKLFP